MNHGWDYRVGLSVPPGTPPPETVQEVARHMLEHPEDCQVAIVTDFGIWLDAPFNGHDLVPLPYETT